MWKKVIPAAALAGALTMSSVLAANPFGEPGDRGHYVDVQLLGINDFHGQLDTVTKINGREAGGADYLAAYLREHEKQNRNTLLVHAGDAVGGSPPVSALLQDEPTINILNTLGFDVGTLGNHEFDEGVSELKRLIYGGYHPATGNFKGADFPYVAANVVDKKTGKLLLPAFTIKMVQGVPIGFIGVVTTETKSIVLASAIENVKFTDEVAAINKYSAMLKRMGVKSIVVLAHNPGETKDGTTTGDIVRLAQQTDPEVDVIFGAHNHKLISDTINNKLVVQAYSYGAAFADVDLRIDRKTRDIIQKKAEVIPTYRDAIQPDPEIKAMVDGYKERVKPLVERVVGESATALTRTQSNAGESSLGNLIADAQRAATGTQIAFMNPGGIRLDLDAGPITWGELYGIQPFNNQLMKFTLTGKDIIGVLNQQWADPTKVRMLQISGLKYTWDNSKPYGQKIVSATLADGTPITETGVYTVGANAFIATGGDGFTIFKNGQGMTAGPIDLDALVEYVQKANGPINVQVEGRMTRLN
ncbi:bifunctional metallophosphatase/5'-nucleotidase [Ectobacillus ponti]|uniref:5'-nucleotidase C-terminal domain-containing protein n=1 Tax=Ectobacillus ponti TaxID=2961894 RepID=A0AA42BN05_9BACI|nr:5'-nucleotidase C-terminal domain-containing protein [Ectobacillus ponti]MCP8966971.1 5'-nucleotidase C-terminal domain-containing protein [Ectobacillus ponti]